MTASTSARGALVTGAAQRIGRAIALGLANDGWHPVVHYHRSGDAAAETVAAIEGRGGTATAVAADLSDPDAAAGLVAAAAAATGGLGCLVNNASMFAADDIGSVGAAGFDAIMAVNLRAPFLLAQALAPKMIEQRRGKIVNVSSLSGVVALDDHGAYCASKGGVIALTRAAAGEWAAQNIRINCICPGGIVTGISGFNQDPEQTRAMLSRIHPVHRAGEPVDIANAALWLASDESTFVTGQAIVVDGGWVGVDDRYDELTGRDWSQV